MIYKLIVKDFDSLTDLRDQYLDFIDRNGYYANCIQMTQKQLEKYDSLLEKWGKTELPVTYRGCPIEIHE